MNIEPKQVIIPGGSGSPYIIPYTRLDVFEHGLYPTIEIEYHNARSANDIQYERRFDTDGYLNAVAIFIQPDQPESLLITLKR